MFGVRYIIKRCQDDNGAMAVAIFTSRSNSQDFHERRVSVTESVKIGRSVAKVKSSPTNCIFDCKVLSRNHAIVWYEGGKDTKSSNGTFINNVRLSKGAEESEPKEIFSGDIVQFGVEVVENSKKGTVTHGCIIATLTLFGPDGKEVTRNSWVPESGRVQSYELWQLSQYVQDALHREQILENKIATLQRFISEAQTTADETFESIIQEDKLLTRLETLENHLDIVTKNCTEDEMKQELMRLHEDKNQYEMTAKEALRKITEEKLRAIERISHLEKSCNNAEDECSHYQSLYDRAQKELEDLAEKHRQRLDEMRTLHEQLEKSERRHIAFEEQINKERESTNEKLNIASKKEFEYVSRLESLQAECDFRKEQLVAMRAQMDKKIAGTTANHVGQNVQNNIDEGGTNPISLVEETIKVLKEKLLRLQDESKNKQEAISVIKEKLELFEGKGVEDDETGLQSLQSELLQAEKDLKQIQRNIDLLEEQLMSCHLKAVDDLDRNEDGQSIIDTPARSDGRTLVVVGCLEPKSSPDRDRSDKSNRSSLNKSNHESAMDVRNHLEYAEGNTNYDLDMLDDLEAELQNVRNQLRSHRPTVSTEREDLPQGLLNDDGSHRSDEMETYQEMISSRRYTIAEASEDGYVTNEDEQTVLELREKIVAQEQHNAGKDQLRIAETKASEVKQEILSLRDKLLEEQETARTREEMIAQLHTQVNELTRSRSLSELEKTTEHRVAESAKSTAKHMQKQAALSAEKASQNKVKLRTLQEENKFLTQRVQTLESELKWSKKEKQRLVAEKDKRDGNQHHHKTMNNTKDVNPVKKQVEDRLQNSVENVVPTEDSATRIHALVEENSRLKCCLLPVFFILLAMLASFAFGILGKAHDKIGLPAGDTTN